LTYALHLVFSDPQPTISVWKRC